MNWYDDLCEYYNVTAEQAEELGTRRTGRRPDFPPSPTCSNPPRGLTFEEIWDGKPRDTIQQKMDFYKDLGPWQCFRQTIYRRDFDYSVYFNFLNFNSNKLVIVEYGCGISHLINHIVNLMGGRIPSGVKFILVDVAGEHLEFAKWRLKKKAPDASFEFHEITSEYQVPKFNDKIDFTLITDVLEHLPNPFDVITNITESSSPKARLVETWIDHEHHGYADLEEAYLERDKTLKYMNEKYTVINRLGAGDVRVRELK